MVREPLLAAYSLDALQRRCCGVDRKDFAVPVICREASQVEAKWLGMLVEGFTAELARQLVEHENRRRFSSMRWNCSSLDSSFRVLKRWWRG